MLQHCTDCDRYVYYPRSHCPGCLTRDLEWRELSGNGVVHTYTVARRPTAPPWSEDVPQLIAVVELDEGPRLTTELVNVEPDRHRGGDARPARLPCRRRGDAAALRARLRTPPGSYSGSGFGSSEAATRARLSSAMPPAV